MSAIKVVLKISCVVILMNLFPVVITQAENPFVGILPPFLFPDHEVKNCWSSLQNINGCVSEIFGFLSNGNFGSGSSFLTSGPSLGPACCKAITEISTSCWPKIFPFNPFISQVLKFYCAHGGVKLPLEDSTITAAAQASALSGKRLEKGESLATFGGMVPPFGGMMSPFGNIGNCLSPFMNSQGCLQEVMTSMLSHQVRLLGPACCKLFNSVDSNCLPGMFPPNPFFPPLLRNYCTHVSDGQSTPSVPSLSPPSSSLSPPSTSLPPPSPSRPPPLSSVTPPSPTLTPPSPST